MPGRFFYPTGRWRHTGSALSLKDARKSHDIIPDNERLVYYLANILNARAVARPVWFKWRMFLFQFQFSYIASSEVLSYLCYCELWLAQWFHIYVSI